jgi:hypothetical protein
MHVPLVPKAEQAMLAMPLMQAGYVLPTALALLQLSLARDPLTHA